MEKQRGGGGPQGKTVNEENGVGGDGWSSVSARKKGGNASATAGPGLSVPRGNRPAGRGGGAALPAGRGRGPNHSAPHNDTLRKEGGHADQSAHKTRPGTAPAGRGKGGSAKFRGMHPDDAGTRGQLQEAGHAPRSGPERSAAKGGVPPSSARGRDGGSELDKSWFPELQGTRASAPALGAWASTTRKIREAPVPRVAPEAGAADHLSADGPGSWTKVGKKVPGLIDLAAVPASWASASGAAAGKRRRIVALRLINR